MIAYILVSISVLLASIETIALITSYYRQNRDAFIFYASVLTPLSIYFLLMAILTVL